MLSINDITFAYQKGEPLISQLNLELSEGKIYGLLGLNGAGKTTLLNIITGMLFPKNGTCLLNGYDVRERQPEVMRQLFIVPEQFELPALTGKHFVKLNKSFYPKFNEIQLHDILAVFEVDSGKKLSELSFGQRKKFMIAFSIATNTQLLIFDEPTNGLDIPSKSQFRKIIASLDADSRCIVISTHQVRDIGTMLDHMMVLKDGSIVFNQELARINEHLSFKKIKTDSTEDYIYGEEVLGGIEAIFPAGIDSDSDIDLELLFNGIIQKTTQINKAFEELNS